MKRVEVELENGVLALTDEGQTVEAVGFTTGTSQRIPVSQITGIEMNRGILTISAGGRNILPLSLSLKGEEAESAELAEFLDFVRTNALNLEE